jgi:hypothetical protein
MQSSCTAKEESKRGEVPLFTDFPFPIGEGDTGSPAKVPKGRRAGDRAITTEQLKKTREYQSTAHSMNAPLS